MEENKSETELACAYQQVPEDDGEEEKESNPHKEVEDVVWYWNIVSWTSVHPK